LGRRNEIDFSFSGLKTSLRYRLEKMSAAEVETRRADLCASYQQAVVDALVRKYARRCATVKEPIAASDFPGAWRTTRCCGRAWPAEARRMRLPFLAAEPRHTGDNAGMIAFAAWMDRARNEGAGPGLALRIEPGAALA
jgi:N6-L-threonylcarbamoyladenine synthase